MKAAQFLNHDNFQFPVSWEVLSNRLIVKFPHLANANLSFEQGREEELFARLETLLNRRREDIMNILTETGRNISLSLN
jgi:hypothetical protein